MIGYEVEYKEASASCGIVVSDLWQSHDGRFTLIDIVHLTMEWNYSDEDRN